MERMLLEFAIRTSLIVLTTVAALRVLRIRSAAAQHALLAGALLAMLALPVWMLWGPKASLPVLPARPAVVMNAAAPASLTPPAPDEIAMPLEIPDAPASKPPSWSWNEVLLGAYLLGAGALLLRLAIGTYRATQLTSASCAAPVTVGLLRPRIILPESSSEWTRSQMDAVMTHERAHARRRDPLVQWLALFNRAVFWFHPLAWWLERKLSELAEEACDAAVLERGHDPRQYSIYLLELARAVRQAGTRVNVVAMAMPGSYLPRRVRKIIEGMRAPRVSRTRLAFAVAACAIPGGLFATGTLDRAPRLLPLGPLPARPLPLPPVILTQNQLTQNQLTQNQTQPQAAASSNPDTKLVFEVASVRALDPVTPNTNGGSRVTGGPGTQDPTRIRYTQTSIFQILTRAFLVQGDQLVGPDWVTQPYGAERFEVIANVRPGATQEQAGVMMENLLKDRFHLAYHREKRNLDVYELTVAKGGSKLRDAEVPSQLPVPEAGKPAQTFKGDDGYPNLPPGWPDGVGLVEGSSSSLFFGFRTSGAFRLSPPNSTFSGGKLMIWRVAMRMVSMPEFVGWLQSLHALQHAVDHTGLTGKYDIRLRFSNGGSSGGDDASEPAPDFFEALEKQLGLKLQKTKAPLDVIVIDHIDKTPTEN